MLSKSKTSWILEMPRDAGVYVVASVTIDGGLLEEALRDQVEASSSVNIKDAEVIGGGRVPE